MKTRIEKQETAGEEQDDLKALFAALPLSHPDAYLVSGETYLEGMGTFDFDPELFKEFEEMENAALHRNL